MTKIYNIFSRNSDIKSYFEKENIDSNDILKSSKFMLSNFSPKYIKMKLLSIYIFLVSFSHKQQLLH